MAEFQGDLRELDEDLAEQEATTGCSIAHGPEEQCPECCGFGGWYAPGTETCEFCRYVKDCRDFQAEKGSKS